MQEKLVFIVKEGSKTPELEMIRDDINVFHKIIGCDCVDMPLRYIDNKPFRIICDDCGLLKDRRCTMAGRLVDGVGPIMIVGTVIIAQFDKKGENLRDLTREEISWIRKNLVQDAQSGQVVIANTTTRPVTGD